MVKIPIKEHVKRIRQEAGLDLQERKKQSTPSNVALQNDEDITETQTKVLAVRFFL
jgi:hypothetical protein